MRILQICSARDIGGGERHVIDLSNALIKSGHEVFFALSPQSRISKQLVNIKAENILLSRLRNALDLSSALKIARFIKANDIEIIHAHIGRDYNLAAIAARLTKKPFIITRHVLFPLKSINKLALKNTAGIIAVSNAVAETLKETFPASKIKVIHNGINLSRFPFAPKVQTDVFSIGTIGHLSPIKGHDVFIKAAKIVLEKRNDVHFTIVGEDKSSNGENRRKLTELISELNLEAKIFLRGWSDEVNAVLNKFDLFISAARSEPFGLVIVEAMAAGVPVIATQTEGASEIIENNISGILTPIENAKLLANEILNLLESKTAKESLARNARKRVEENFSLKKMVAETVDFYASVLEKS